jgi:hypothetical protein
MRHFFSHVLLRLTFFVIAIASIAGCSDPEEEGYLNDYFPAKENDAFLFRTHVLSPEGDTVATYLDSVRYIKSTSIDGRNAEVGLVFTSDVNNPLDRHISDTLFYDIRSGTIDQFISPTNVKGLPDVTFPRQWTHFADFDYSELDSVTFDTLVRDVPFIAGDQTYRGTGTITQRNVRKATAVIPLENSDHTPVLAQEFRSTTTYDFKVLIAGDSLPISYQNIEAFFFARDRGLVKHTRQAYNVVLGATTVPVNGLETVLIGRR